VQERGDKIQFLFFISVRSRESTADEHSPRQLRTTGLAKIRDRPFEVERRLERSSRASAPAAALLARAPSPQRQRRRPADRNRSAGHGRELQSVLAPALVTQRFDDGRDAGSVDTPREHSGGGEHVRRAGEREWPLFFRIPEASAAHSASLRSPGDAGEGRGARGEHERGHPRDGDGATDMRAHAARGRLARILLAIVRRRPAEAVSPLIVDRHENRRDAARKRENSCALVMSVVRRSRRCSTHRGVYNRI